MEIILIGCLLSAVMAEMLSEKSIKIRLFHRDYNIRGFIYFIPIWLMLVFKWNTNPDVTFPYGSYWIFFHESATSSSIPGLFALHFAREPLSWGLIWVLARLGFSYFWMLAVFATLFCISYAIYIDKLSKNLAISIVFFALLSVPTILGALRQAMSLTFLLTAYAIVLGTQKLSKKQWLKIVVVLLLGGLCHQSCLLMIPLFFLANIPLSRNFALFSLITLILLFPFISNLIQEAVRLTHWSGSLEGERAVFTISYLILAGFIFLILFLFYPQVRKLNGGRWAFTLVTGYVALMFFSSSLIDSARLLHCFTPLMIIILPNVIANLRVKENRGLILIAVFFVFAILFGRTLAVRKNTSFFYHSVFFVNREDVFELR